MMCCWRSTAVEAIVPSNIPGLDVVPATVDLSGAEIELVEFEDRAGRLREALAGHTQHDICFIDCPPSLGLLTLNALTAADTLLVPLQCEFFALEGLSQLLQTVETVQQRFNADLGIVGVALTMFDRRNRLTDQVAEDVRGCLGNLVFESVIPRNVRLSEAPSHGLPALIYDHACAGSRAYMAAGPRIDRAPAGTEEGGMSDENEPVRLSAVAKPDSAARWAAGWAPCWAKPRREEPLVVPCPPRDSRAGRGLCTGSARRRCATGSPASRVASIAPHPDQPRRHFDEDALSELAASIAARGGDPAGDRSPAAGWWLSAGCRRTPLASRAKSATA